MPDGYSNAVLRGEREVAFFRFLYEGGSRTAKRCRCGHITSDHAGDIRRHLGACRKRGCGCQEYDRVEAA